jgi:hypothetical protein
MRSAVACGFAGEWSKAVVADRPLKGQPAAGELRKDSGRREEGQSARNCTLPLEIVLYPSKLVLYPSKLYFTPRNCTLPLENVLYPSKLVLGR